MLKIKQGSFGLKVNVGHNSSTDVFYSVDNGSYMPLVNNNYFVITSQMTSSLGTHTVKFKTQDSNVSIPSDDVYTYQVI